MELHWQGTNEAIPRLLYQKGLSNEVRKIVFSVNQWQQLEIITKKFAKNVAPVSSIDIYEVLLFNG